MSALTGGVVSGWEAGPFDRPGSDAIDLWLVELDEDVASASAPNAAEYERTWAQAARRELVELLGRATECRPNAVELALGCRGKPRLRARGTPPVFFNVSRSGPLALFAISACSELGIDIERRARHDPDVLAAVIDRHMPREREAFAADTGNAAAEEDLLLLWARHEAVAKALGLGLSVRFASMLGLYRSTGSLQFQGGLWEWRDIELPEHTAAYAALAYRVLPDDERCG